MNLNVTARIAGWRWLATAFASVAAVSALATGVADATPASSAMDGVWSFNGGQVNVTTAPDGTSSGVVTLATKFAVCDHPVGERMWTNIHALADGSFSGLHQWFHSDASGDCSVLGVGLTAWRVMTKSDGSRYLRVCFNRPGEAAPPTIAADGTATNSSFGCADSAYVAATPAAAQSAASQSSAGAIASAGVPFADHTTTAVVAGKQCTSRRHFSVQLRKLPRRSKDRYVSATIKVNGKRVKTVKGSRVTSDINLIGLPRGPVKVSIVARTALHRTLRGTRTYHLCAKKAAATTPAL